jgi:15-cis-phytoene synthase
VTPTVEEAYQACREIARKQAKNFYYAFIALPRAKRDAICAVYAFMRHADDLSDDESIPLAERHIQMAAWIEAWHAVAQGHPTADPVFIALADAQARFEIPAKLLDQLVQGVTMDLHRDKELSDGYDTYATFADLYQYCYLVASVVGLVCIRIFGYSDPRAEKLAEETGIAFQLTNILRDVSEDLERGRIYLPLEDMGSHSVSIQDLEKLTYEKLHLSLNTRELLTMEAKRTETYYESGRALLPLISRDARPALWVLIRIYQGLLKQIEQRNYEVFTQRIQVSTAAKLMILAAGLLQALANRFRAGN